MRTLGLNLGASTISLVDLSMESAIKINQYFTEPNDGNLNKKLTEMLSNLDLSQYDNIGVTGRKFRDRVDAPSISEPEAVEYALDYVGVVPGHDLVVSAGGETFMLYVLGKDGTIANVHTGNKCASGTGEFFLQQIRRMDLDLEHALEIAKPDASLRISSRCSVFCKSDCTHALNKGKDKGQVVSELGRMIATKIWELISKTKKNKITLIGGVSKNQVAVNYLREHVDSLHIPQEAAYFEALGAGLWALHNKKNHKIALDTLFKEERTQFTFLSGLDRYKNMVAFKKMKPALLCDDDECLIGLDVGSTTTKAVLFRISDDAILASVYLRTNGDPVGAAKECYANIDKQVSRRIKIIGLGVTGSGRQIAGLHALTDGIINEIIAHANAAVYFDSEVDTIFEIGGQDAKYTYLTNGAPNDYAMNEACSAGTGSFLEESAKESLNIDVKDIADLALSSDRPPNFNDQCAAFISSDIKNASHEGIKKADVVAGLVYSICMNYVNRVKGARPVGKKVFMQGGVCYNRAVPIAMAALVGKEIIVPPEPGLMGAFGVALAVKERLSLGLIEAKTFNLQELSGRDVKYQKPFVCRGGKNKCDRTCEIAMVKINDKKYPFGGACNRYYNMRIDKAAGISDNDLIQKRQDDIFNFEGKDGGKTIGVAPSFLTHVYYPLFFTFFTELGFEVVLSNKPQEAGINKKNASFCFPFELAHGFFHDLLKKDPDYVFLPHILELPVKNIAHKKNTCVFVQSEGYVLKTTFKEELVGKTIISPVLNFSRGIDKQKMIFVNMGVELTGSIDKSTRAFSLAVKKQKTVLAIIKERTTRFLTKLETTDDFAVVLFGRPYNAYPKEANMAIPKKFTSRGIQVIPFDSLPYEDEPDRQEMFWAMGQVILRCAQYVKKHKQLFGAYITNFSCGPDSFILGYFRDIMGMKPSLTLELDSQTADAGIDTRIEAFLDVVESFRQLKRTRKIREANNDLAVPTVRYRGGRSTVTINGKTIRVKDIKIVYPSMGHLVAELAAAATESAGFRSEALPPVNEEDLRLGKGHTSGKECLPMILTTGSLLRYLENRKDSEELTGFFMIKQIEPCRIGHYSGFLEEVIRKYKLANVAIISVTDQDGFSGLGDRYRMKSWPAFLLGDLLEDVRNALDALAENRESALKILDEECVILCNVIRKNGNIYRQLESLTARIQGIKLRRRYEDATKILFTGEIFVRKDGLSRQYLAKKLADKGYVVKVTPLCESVYYTNYLTRKRIEKHKLGRLMQAHVDNAYFIAIEKKIRKILSATGLCNSELIDISETLHNADHLVGKRIKGETSLTIGATLSEILNNVSGVISLGPFGCMPARVGESILTQEMTLEGKERAGGEKIHLDVHELPFLAIESDAGAFPQVIEARIETFCLQADRIHEKMTASR